MALLVAVTASCGGGKSHPTATYTEPAGTPGPISIEITAPADGSNVTNPVVITYQSSGVRIAPASENVPGAAHYHVFVDQEPVAEGQVIPSGTDIFHTTDTSVQIRKPAGEHTVWVVFGDNAHRRVRDAPVAKVTFTIPAPTPEPTAIATAVAPMATATSQSTASP